MSRPIKFTGGKFVRMDTGNEEWYPEDLEHMGTWTIIGNIHENGDLLK